MPVYAFSEVQSSVKKSLTPAEAIKNKYQEVVDQILFVIDGEPYTLIDFKDYLNIRGEKAPTDMALLGPETSRLIREMIVDKLLSKESITSGMAVSEDEVDAYIDEIKSQNKVDDVGFERLLQSRGITFSDYKEQVKSDILRTRVIGSRVRSKVNVIDQDVEQYLDAHPERKPKEGSLRIEQLFFPLTETDHKSSTSQVRAAAEQIHEMLKKRGDFARVSPGNYRDLGFMRPEDLRADLADAVSRIKTGNLSEIVETSNGFYIIKVDNKSEGVVGQEVKRELFEQKFKVALDKFLNEELPKKYNLEMKTPSHTASLENASMFQAYSGEEN